MNLYKKALFILLISSGCIAQQPKEVNKSNKLEVKKSVVSLQKINLGEEFRAIKPMELKKLVTINNHSVKVVKLKGDYKMHKHLGGEKLFMVIEGTLFIELLDKTIVQIKEGEIIKIPKGLVHKPSSPEGVSLLFFEI